MVAPGRGRERGKKRADPPPFPPNFLDLSLFFCAPLLSPSDTDVENNLTVAISSDKGLCGGVNSAVSKYTRAVVAAEAAGEGKKSTMVVIGEKGRAQLGRGPSAADIVATVADYGKVRVTFSQVSAIAGLLLAKEYDVCRLVYNRFVSAISYKPTIATILSPDALEKAAEAGGGLDAYEVEGPDRAELLQSMAELQLGAAVYNAFLESFVSEQSARMAAMESSSKNASELISKLTLSYNRSRQAAITTELTEIISGAAALEG